MTCTWDSIIVTKPLSLCVAFLRQRRISKSFDSEEISYYVPKVSFNGRKIVHLSNGQRSTRAPCDLKLIAEGESKVSHGNDPRGRD